MHSKMRGFLISGAVMALGACAGEQDDAGPMQDVDGPGDDEDDEARAYLTGQLLDTDETPVANAEVVLAIGSVPVTEPVFTDEEGWYTLPVPTDRVQAAWAGSQEVTVMFTSPDEDREPYGTVEGDNIHMLPASLGEMIAAQEVIADRRAALKTAYVPRQGKGYPITDELVARGGELTWTVDDSQYGKGFRVTLIVEPGSIHRGALAQDELTLTLLEQTKAPMAIPEDGFGPMWSIQPRDVVFDPPARVRIEGERFPVLGPSELAVGERAELFGASLESGWQLFGDIELVDEAEGRVVLETPEGIISRGAWGHIYSASGNDYGMLVECYSKATGARVQCAVLNDNAYWYQDPNNYNNWNITNLCQNPNFTPPAGVGGGYDDGFLTCDQYDFGTGSSNGNAMVYASDAETRCRGCGGSVAPYVLAMTAGDTIGGSTAPVWGAFTAFPLCPSEYGITDMNLLWSRIYTRLGLDWAQGNVFPWDATALSAVVSAQLSWRNFSTYARVYLPEPANCQ
jgi:hypothetical protein